MMEATAKLRLQQTIRLESEFGALFEAITLAKVTLKDNHPVGRITLFTGDTLLQGGSVFVSTLDALRMVNDSHVDIKFTKKDKDNLLNLSPSKLGGLIANLGLDDDTTASQLVAKLVISKPKSKIKSVVESVTGGE